MSEAPILVLLAASGASLANAGAAPGRDGDPIILGLSLTQRTALAAHRAGYAQVFLLGGDDHAPGIAPMADWTSLAASLSSPLPASLILAPAAILAEGDWLERLASARVEPAGWGTIPHRIVMLPAASIRAAAEAFDQDGGARGLGEVEARLASRFGPPARILASIDPLIVETTVDVRAAERRLLRSLVKDTDGFMARHVERPISLQISRRLAGTGITPNQMSLISIAVGICGGPFFLSSRPLMQTIGALLFLAHSILDGCDGELARLKFQQSRWGGVLDFWGDNVVHTIIFGCMGIGWSLAAGSLWPLCAWRRSRPWDVGLGRVRLLAADALEGWRRDDVHLCVRCARAAAHAAPRLRFAPRFHLSRYLACAFWPIELVSGHGWDRRADLFFFGAFRSAAAGLLGWRRGRRPCRAQSNG